MTLIFWLTMFVYLCYARGEWLRDKHLKYMQNYANNKMETLL